MPVHVDGDFCRLRGCEKLNQPDREDILEYRLAPGGDRTDRSRSLLRRFQLVRRENRRLENQRRVARVASMRWRKQASAL